MRSDTHVTQHTAIAEQLHTQRRALRTQGKGVGLTRGDRTTCQRRATYDVRQQFGGAFNVREAIRGETL